MSRIAAWRDRFTPDKRGMVTESLISATLGPIDSRKVNSRTMHNLSFNVEILGVSDIITIQYQIRGHMFTNLNFFHVTASAKVYLNVASLYDFIAK